MNAATIRSFHVAVYTWIALYLLALLLMGTAAWTQAPVDLFVTRAGFPGWLQRSINALPAWSCFTVCVLVMVFAIAQVQRHRWWLGVIVWLLFRIITHRTWLASNGGIQLVENMLLWSALISPFSRSPISTFAFWAARLQLPLVYAAAAAHKFTGTTWLDGSAMLLVANDPAFHLGFLAGSPVLCKFISWCTLAFMTLFPLAIWWAPSRRMFLIIGAVFHLFTAFFMDIPQMGLAFIACYAIWLEDSEARWIMDRIPFRAKRRTPEAVA